MPATMQGISTGVLIQVDGAELPDAWRGSLGSVRVQRSLGTVGRATLRFADVLYLGYETSTDLVGWWKLNGGVTIKQYDGPVLFRGAVTGIALNVNGDQTPELVVTADDPLIALTRTTASRSYTNMTYASILAKVFGNYSSLSHSLTLDSEQPEYTLQSSTDLDFLEGICRRTDTAWWYDPVDEKVHVKTPVTGSPVVTLKVGPDEGTAKQLARLSVRASAHHSDKVVVRGWDAAKGTLVTGTSSPLPAAETALVAGYPGRSGRGATERVVTGLGPATQHEAALLATSLAREARAQAVTARGEVELDGTIAPGASVKVDVKPTDGTFLVTEVEHVFDHSRGARTTFVAGSHRPSGLVDLLGGAKADPGFRVTHVVAATVVDVEDTTSQGRVKVSYPMPRGDGTDVVSNWARTVSLGGGAGRGMVFLPEVDDEVLVAFEGGDTRRPVVLGGLFNEGRGLPAGDAAIKEAKVNFRRIASRSGNLIELSDEAGKEHVLIKHGKATHSIKMDKDAGLVVTIADGPIKLTNGKATIELTKEGDIKLTGGNVTITASKNVSIEATQKLTGKGTNGVALQGLKVDVKADMAGSVEAGGPLTIKGATVAIN